MQECLTEEKEALVQLSIAFRNTPQAHNQLRELVEYLTKQIRLHEVYNKRFYLKSWTTNVNETTLKKTFSQVINETAFSPKKQHTIIKH